MLRDAETVPSYSKGIFIPGTAHTSNIQIPEDNLQFNAHTRNWPTTVVTASFPHHLVLVQIILWGIILTTFQIPK